MLIEFGWLMGGGNLGVVIVNFENVVCYFWEIIVFLNEYDIGYFYFVMIDEKWKEGDEGGLGVYWGLFNFEG